MARGTGFGEALSDRRTDAGRRRRQVHLGSIRQWRRYAWPALLVSCACYLVISLAFHQAYYPWGRLNYFDLRVYRGAAQLILNHGPLYDVRIWQWAPFTYPPIAAIAFTPLALLPLVVDEVLVTLLNVVMLFAVLTLALRLPSGRHAEANPGPLWRSAFVPLATAGALWLEPVTATLGYGQINLLIALLILLDLNRDDTARGKGTLIGLAAGLKLTPLIFVPYLFLSHRRRAAFVALATFVSTVAVGYVLLPRDSQTFWGGGLVFDARRLGGCCVPANQSLRGAILGLLPSCRTVWLLAIALTVGIVGVGLASLSSRRGDEGMGFSRCATTGLLVSPVSWTHHWALAVPALLLLGVRVVRWRSRFGTIAVAGVLLVGYSYLPKLLSKPGFFPRWGPALGWTLASAIYVLIGLVALAVACVYEIRMRSPLGGRQGRTGVAEALGPAGPASGRRRAWWTRAAPFELF
jgi:alpha-1,2-mannosyltransferase